MLDEDTPDLPEDGKDLILRGKVAFGRAFNLYCGMWIM